SPEISVAEVAGDASLELPARCARETRIAHAPIVAIISADVEPPVLADRSVHVEVGPRQVPRATVRHEAALHFGATGLLAGVDDRARRVRAEERRPGAPHEDRKSVV